MVLYLKEHTQNRQMKRFALLLILPLAFACKTAKDTVEIIDTSEQNSTTETVITTNIPDPNDSQTKPQRPYRVKATIGDVSQKTDSYSILNAEIEGNLLIMNIEYSGGCAWHKFEFVGNRAVSKSLPPQRSVKLLHDNDDDQCESMVQQTIEVDITELAFAKTAGSEITLNLAGYDEPLKYVFP